ncbi:WYL domain-containing protein [Gynuella sunshinyii]|uniref:Putative transcriptional regulator n=1 Tax=Gynuella sunshinyii YC6258 TaxID=1445510 RepID=A0A0C5V0E5_9GAMM|nr:WYL domain-containing protein [Gynuella sunshinyii]AJQ93040.1 putative transcriptional regulator [Gynuella sunshinyii YC6258]
MNYARFWFIELLAYWEGKINTLPIQHQFGLSRQTSSNLLKQYRTENPGNLEYGTHDKAYVAKPDFKPQYIDQSVDEYFDWLTSRTFPSSPETPFGITQLKPPRRYVSPLITRKLIPAMREKQRLEIDYLSITSNDPEGRIISPHSLVKTATRWHVRAWCEKRQRFLDFVLSRFKGEPQVEGPAVYGEAHDEDWNTWVDIIVAPDSRLSAGQKQVIESDYGMQNGHLTLTVRGPLVKYTIDDLQIKTKMIELRPEAQQLICLNFDEIENWLY